MSATSIMAALQVVLLAETHIDTVYWNLSKDRAISADEVLVLASYSIAGSNRLDSNIAYEVMEFSLTVAKKLAVGGLFSRLQLEGVYTTTEMAEIQSTLMERDFYDVAGVHEVESVPELAPATPVGNVVEFTITVQVSITP